MTPRIASLRRRVTLACAALGFVMSLLFSIAVIALSEDYEYVLAKEILRGQAEDYGLRIANHLPVQLPRTQRLSGYLAKPPPEYADFKLGVHEDPNREGIHVGVFDTSAGRMYFVIDLGDIEALEVHLHLLLVLFMIVGVAVAGWLGWVFAGRALAPVAKLSHAVDALPDAPTPTQLQALVGDDELGHLARAIDAYQARLVDADARQLAFFADASHALRTPIAVVQGVAEVLLDEPTQDPATRARLDRMDRGMQELVELIELLFGAARRAPVQREHIGAADLLREALASWSGDLSIDANSTCDVAHRETVLLLRALARKHFRDAKRLHAAGGVDGFALSDFDALDAASPTRSDAGAVSPLLERAAQRAGWLLRVEPGRVVLSPRPDQ
jgi:signal transduction histidine kinase